MEVHTSDLYSKVHKTEFNCSIFYNKSFDIVGLKCKSLLIMLVIDVYLLYMF